MSLKVAELKGLFHSSQIELEQEESEMKKGELIESVVSELATDEC